MQTMAMFEMSRRCVWILGVLAVTFWLAVIGCYLFQISLPRGKVSKQSCLLASSHHQHILFRVALARSEATLPGLMHRTAVFTEEIISSVRSCPSPIRRLASRRSPSIKPIFYAIPKIISATMATGALKPAFGKLDIETPLDDRTTYKPFLLDEQTTASDWISELELDTAEKMARQDLLTTSQPLRILILYGSLRKRYDLITPN